MMARVWTWGVSAFLHLATVGVGLYFGVGGRADGPVAPVSASSPAPFLVDVADVEADGPEFDREPLSRAELHPADAAVDFSPARLDLAPIDVSEPLTERTRPAPAFDRPVRPTRATLRVRVPDPSPRVETATAPVQIENAPPPYPAAARRRGIEGEVVVEIEVRADGTCGEASLVECTSPLFGEAVLSAVRGWKFLPAHQDGRPIAVSHRVRFIFRLHG
jgi:protein TonB